MSISAEALVKILEFLTDYRTIITGAALAISELIVIIINMIRKINSRTQTYAFLDEKVLSSSFLKMLIWSANPVNLFRSA